MRIHPIYSVRETHIHKPSDMHRYFLEKISKVTMENEALNSFLLFSRAQICFRAQILEHSTKALL